ncbi:MAG: ATP-binding protein [Solirubrobacteraceae bacterium]
MTATWVAHAVFQARRGYDEQPCSGQLVIVDQAGPIWTIECDVCGFEAGLPASEADPASRRRLQLEQADRWRRASGIPAQLRDWTLERIGLGVKPQVLAAARAWAAGESRGLLLSGPVGVGKTSLAAAAASARLRQVPVRWLSVPALFAKLGLAFADEERHDALRILVAQTAIVLDDIDKSRPSDYAAEQLFLAIDSRVNAGASLLVTTNLALSQLAERFPEPYGEAIASRLVGYCPSFALEGHDRRTEGVAA